MGSGKDRGGIGEGSGSARAPPRACVRARTRALGGVGVGSGKVRGVFGEGSGIVHSPARFSNSLQLLACPVVSCASLHVLSLLCTSLYFGAAPLHFFLHPLVFLRSPVHSFTFLVCLESFFVCSCFLCIPIASPCSSCTSSRGLAFHYISVHFFAFSLCSPLHFLAAPCFFLRALTVPYSSLPFLGLGGFALIC